MGTFQLQTPRPPEDDHRHLPFPPTQSPPPPPNLPSSSSFFILPAVSNSSQGLLLPQFHFLFLIASSASNILKSLFFFLGGFVLNCQFTRYGYGACLRGSCRNWFRIPAMDEVNLRFFVFVFVSFASTCHR